MEQLKNILWIDDGIESSALRPYIDEFNENGFTIIRAANPDECDEILNSRQDFQCIIVDISMPLGQTIKYGEAKGGFLTGLVVLKKIVDNPKVKNVKKIVFTIVENNADVREYCTNNHIEYLEKQRYLADTFVAKVKDILSQNKLYL
jgi:CheY-like chemotaxis protein